MADQTQQTGSSDQSEKSRLSERRSLEKPHCEKIGDAAMYVMRIFKCFFLDACYVGDLQNKTRNL